MTPPALQTSANSAIPAGLRRKKPAMDAGASGHAAGILFVAPDGDVLLVRRSSTEANYAGHWALPGGKAEDAETPEAAAEREVTEELGRKPDGAGKVLDRRATPTGMVFHTFAYPVADKFAPKLNAEHSGYAWVPLDQLPRPLHPGVEATLSDQLGIGADMKSDDWKGLRDGFLKWTMEENAEPEHASDAKLALDRDTVRTVDSDGRLHVAMANISKATVNPYRGNEIPDYERLGLEPQKIYHLLRDPAELEKAAATFNGIQVLKKHVPVNADDHQPYDVVGATGTDAKFDHPYLRNSLVVWARDAIDDIDSDEKKELSCGYRYRAEMTPGSFGGIPFDGVMREIVGNHVALVKDGRAGPDVVIGDSNISEDIMSNEAVAKQIKAVANRTVSIAALSAYLSPKLAAQHIAMDSKPLGIMARVFDGVTGTKFKGMKPIIAQRFKELAKPNLAKDASLDDVEKVLDMLDGHEVDGGDESVSEAQHNAMEAAAHGNSTLDIPKKVGAEFVSKDAGGEALKGFLKEKGMGEDDISHALGLMSPAAANDESDDEDEKKKKAAADEAEAKKKDDDEKAAKDAQMKDMVTKPAMDAAITAATDATAKKVRETERGIRTALARVRPYVGELPATLAFDSADDVYRHTAVMLNIPDAKNIHASALPTVIEMQPKAGARPSQQVPALGMDAAALDGINKIAPGLARIGIA